MSFTMEDSLESGWVAVRPNVFEEKEKHKFAFIVAWNEVEGKCAITCHNRTVQRRSLIRDSPVRTTVKGCSTLPSAAATSSGPGRVHGEDEPPLSPDMDVFHDRPEPEQSLQTEDCSWAGLFSFHDLLTVHQQLCSVSSALGPCLPVFPEEPAGMWSVLFGPTERPPAEMEELCLSLQRYLGHALDTCGWKILSQVLFTESEDTEEYYESLSELKQSGYEEALHRASKLLTELLERHGSMDSMVDLLQLYEEEDQVFGGLLEASTQLYQFLLQPFRDMRELAMLRRQQIKISLANDYLGPRRVEALKQEDCDWQKKAQEAVLNIQDFTVKYFEITARAQKGVYERMKLDQRKFGKASWTAAVERMERLRYSVAKETLQLQRAKEISLEQRKHALKEEMQSLCSSEDAMILLDHMERQYYELQLQLYDIQAEILQCEELLLTAQLQSIRRQMADDIIEVDTDEKKVTRRLQDSARQLETRRGRISAKRSYLRNKRDICTFNHTEKQQGLQKDCISQKLQIKEVEDNKRKNCNVNQERQKTLDRLRTFKQRYPGQVILKSTRLRVPHSRRRERRRSSKDEPEPLYQSTSVQTDPSPTLTTQPVSSLTTCLPLLPVPCSVDSCSPCSLSSLLASPISPPPPPPPPPAKEETSPSLQPGPREKTTHSDTEDSSLSPIGPFVPRFFDSSQLVSARKKLRKTEFETQSRRVSSPMDEVLASLKRGSFHLKKVDQRSMPQAKSDNDANSILAQIRKGVKLRRVLQKDRKDQGELAAPTDPLTKSIHDALRRIKEASPDSDSDDEGPVGSEWES
ncbi:junction-mediating and -regulatory protein-like isoform X2 [Eucyclogobius newberryi]|uniref:junction-mediating and -regulatory protein-like isoform X2 n=1 Tax=Eucyclogobius newberryi TaxID=166745 RepID=UPI003B5CD759